MKLFIASASSNDIPKMYFDDCKDYIKGLLNNNDLVFGTYDEGLMGECYKCAINNNREVMGVCPNYYIEDLEKIKCTKEVITKTISERTWTLIDKCDAIIFLPGGIGTIHELFAAIDSKRNHEIDKPIIIYNGLHYFDELLVFLNKLYNENFSSKKVEECYHISESLRDTLEYLKISV